MLNNCKNYWDICHFTFEIFFLEGGEMGGEKGRGRKSEKGK
jgi:hypothetical protein